MQSTRQRVVVGLVALTVTSMTGCTSAESPEEVAAARASAAATASPGTYGQPADPSLPNPTDVATDAPLEVGPSQDAEVFVTYAGWDADAEAIEVSSFVQGVSETGGVCTLTVTQGGESQNATAPAEADRSATSCGALTVPGTDLAAGSWAAVVTYESSGSRGTSDATEVEVP